MEKINSVFTFPFSLELDSFYHVLTSDSKHFTKYKRFNILNPNSAPSQIFIAT